MVISLDIYGLWVFTSEERTTQFPNMFYSLLVVQETVLGPPLFLLHVNNSLLIVQETVLGPLLFLLHVNDLPSCENSKVHLFVDDCLLYRKIKNSHDQIDTRHDTE